jgi:hypothetical protein
LLKPENEKKDTEFNGYVWSIVYKPFNRL